MVLLVLLLILISYSTVNAGQFTITGLPQTLDATASVEIDLTFTCSGCSKKTNYFIGLFKEQSGTQFFGINTVNNIDINYDSIKDPLQYTAASASADGIWSTRLSVKAIAGDKLSPLFKGAGQYLFHIKRFTPSAADDTWETPIQLLYVPPPTPSPSPSPSPTPRPSPTSPIPTPTPSLPPTTPLPTPTLFPTPHPVDLPISPTIELNPLLSSESGTIAGTINNQPLQENESKIQPTSSWFIPWLFIVGGICSLIGLLSIGVKYFSEN